MGKGGHGSLFLTPGQFLARIESHVWWHPLEATLKLCISLLAVRTKQWKLPDSLLFLLLCLPRQQEIVACKVLYLCIFCGCGTLVPTYSVGSTIDIAAWTKKKCHHAGNEWKDLCVTWQWLVLSCPQLNIHILEWEHRTGLSQLLRSVITFQQVASWQGIFQPLGVLWNWMTYKHLSNVDDFPEKKGHPSKNPPSYDDFGAALVLLLQVLSWPAQILLQYNF